MTKWSLEKSFVADSWYFFKCNEYHFADVEKLAVVVKKSGIEGTVKPERSIKKPNFL